MNEQFDLKNYIHNEIHNDVINMTSSVFCKILLKFSEVIL